MNSFRGRGRGGGGGSRRPYYYFRRNGKTIPACGGNNGETSRGWGPRTSRKKRGWGSGARAPPPPGGTPVAPVLDSSFLRPEFFARPEDALQVQSFSAESPIQCPGYRLYFRAEKFDVASDLFKRISVLGGHYQNNPNAYNLLAIKQQRCFALSESIIASDQSVLAVWPSLLEDLRQRPLRTLATIAVAMHAAVHAAAVEASLSQETCTLLKYVPRFSMPPKIYARPEGFRQTDLLRDIENSHLDSLYCVRGTVVAMGSVESSVAWLTFHCGRCKHVQVLRQKGNFILKPFGCKRDECHAKTGFIEKRSSSFTQIRTLQVIRLSENHIQALSDDCRVEQHIDIELCDDLVDIVSIGQDVLVTGVLKMRALLEEQGPQSNTRKSRLYLKAVAIRDARLLPQTFGEGDLDAIGAINGEQDSFKLLTHSLAPELHGQEIVKAGVLLTLFGGSGSQLHNESEINTLIVGDPGIGKSHILQMSALISEKGSLNFNRKGPFAANRLTISVQGRSNPSIDAGNLLLAIRGHCAIDDMDRLASQQDNLLQAIQSHCICLPFASIYSTLECRASLIASANSMRGHYNHSRNLYDNIKIGQSLLREFHLVFLLLDRPNRNEDASFTEHVRAMHDGYKRSATIAARYAKKIKTNTSMSVDLDGSKADGEDESRYDLAERLKLNALEEEEMDFIPPLLLKKFIAYARQQVKPLLTVEAAEVLKNFYFELREQKAEQRFNPIAISQLHGLICLTQARARADFAQEATKVHVLDVLCIVRQCMADTTIGNYIDTNPAAASTSTTSTPAAGRSGQVKRFIQMLQMRSNALGRRIFDFDDLKDMASRAGISCGVTNLIEMINMQGYLLKKGPNMYEVMEE